MKLVYIYDVEGEDTQAVYINDTYIIGECYAQLECATEIAKFLHPGIEIEVYTFNPRDLDFEDFSGFPANLPENFKELWQTTAV